MLGGHQPVRPGARAAERWCKPPSRPHAMKEGHFCAAQLRPNHSLNRSANGRPPGPVRGAWHSLQPEPGALPLAPG
jgi:hypothetical protein